MGRSRLFSVVGGLCCRGLVSALFVHILFVTLGTVLSLSPFAATMLESRMPSEALLSFFPSSRHAGRRSQGLRIRDHGLKDREVPDRTQTYERNGL